MPTNVHIATVYPFTYEQKGQKHHVCVLFYRDPLPASLYVNEQTQEGKIGKYFYLFLCTFNYMGYVLPISPTWMAVLLVLTFINYVFLVTDQNPDVYANIFSSLSIKEGMFGHLYQSSS